MARLFEKLSCACGLQLVSQLNPYPSIPPITSHFKSLQTQSNNPNYTEADGHGRSKREQPLEMRPGIGVSRAPGSVHLTQRPEIPFSQNHVIPVIPLLGPAASRAWDLSRKPI